MSRIVKEATPKEKEIVCSKCECTIAYTKFDIKEKWDIIMDNGPKDYYDHSYVVCPNTKCSNRIVVARALSF